MNHTQVLCCWYTGGGPTFLEKLKIKYNEISDRPRIGLTVCDIITQYGTAPTDSFSHSVPPCNASERRPT